MTTKGNALIDSATDKIVTSQQMLGDKFYETTPIADNVASGSFYVSGFYNLASAKATLTIGGTVTQTFGTALYASGARALAVVNAASAGATVLTVSGISITDAGVRNDTDSEVLIADCSAVSANQFFQTTKRWLGQVTYTLSGGAGGNKLDFNYGFVRSKSYDNIDYTITGMLFYGLGRSPETDANVEIIHHKATGWTYSASAFVFPSANVICSLKGDYATNDRWADGVYVNWRRNNLSTAIAGKTGGEGLLIRFTSSVNNSLRWGYVRVGLVKTA